MCFTLAVFALFGLLVPVGGAPRGPAATLVGCAVLALRADRPTISWPDPIVA